MSAEIRDDDYKVEPNGDLNLVKKTNDNFDTVTNTNGESIKVNKGVIKEENLNKKIATQNGDDYTYNIYKFDDKKSAVEFYDFMSNPKTNDVEYSISELENSSTKYYTVGTSKEYSAEVSWSISFGNDFQKDKTTKLNAHTHTHFFKRGPSDADKVAKNRFFEIYKNQNTEFRIDCRNCTYGSERETLTH
nr:JAB-like toxin 1 domain-containing protein [Myroides sp. WP-1]